MTRKLIFRVSIVAGQLFLSHIFFSNAWPATKDDSLILPNKAKPVGSCSSASDSFVEIQEDLLSASAQVRAKLQQSPSLLALLTKMQAEAKGTQNTRLLATTRSGQKPALSTILIKREVLLDEHRSILVLLSTITESLENNNYQIEEMLKELKFIAVEHFLNEDLLLFPYIVDIRKLRKEQKTSLFAASSYYHDSPDMLYLGSTDFISKLLSFSKFSIELINDLTNLINNFSPGLVKSKANDLTKQFEILEERIGHEESAIFPLVKFDPQ